MRDSLMSLPLLMAAILGFVVSVAHAQKFENLAPTSPMGWNSWNTFGTNIDEQLIKQTAQAMIDSGMRDAGYIYINLDDGWMARERDADGNLVPDPQKFPNGLKALSDYLHERGFKFGVYNCAGDKTCAGYPGSYQHEEQDAKKYAEWGVDFLKYDWCRTDGRDGAPKRNAKEAYTQMRDALFAAGRPVVFSICEWGSNRPWEWGPQVGHLWRTTGDITDIYEGRERWSMGWKTILDLQVGKEQFAGPDGWNDPDMLEVGNERMTFAESRAHLSLWCMLAAPLIAGNDVRSMTPEIRDVLTNREVIAIDQDPLGRQGYRLVKDDTREIWVKPLANNDWAVCVLNPTGESQSMTLNWSDVTVLTGPHTVRDLWQHKDLGTTDTPVTQDVASHDVMLFRLSPVAP